MNRFNCSYFLADHLDIDTFIIICVVLLAITTMYVLKNQPNSLARLGLLLLVAGALHNLYQRLVYNCVVDNMSFFGLFMFNPADVLVTSGILIIFIGMLKNEQKNSHHRR